MKQEIEQIKNQAKARNKSLLFKNNLYNRDVSKQTGVPENMVSYYVNGYAGILDYFFNNLSRSEQDVNTAGI